MKINKYKLIISALYCFAFVTIQCQTPQQNLDKYWNYRTRFYDKFIIDVDWQTEPYNGINIPAGVYNPTNYGDRDNTVSWGDSQTKISKYLGMLSTEYQLLKLNNKDLSNVKTKIHRALMAMERLDWEAEKHFYCGASVIDCDGITNRNGFFFRDDMNNNSFSYFKDNGKDAWIGMGLKSDYNNLISSGTDINVMSQDMFWNLLTGYSLVTEFVDSDELFPGYDCEQQTLAERAKYQVYLMHRYMQSLSNGNPWGFTLPGTNGYPGYWPWNLIGDIKEYRIKNPCSGDVVPAGGQAVDLYFNSSMFRDAAEIITQNDFGSLNYDGSVRLRIP